MFARNWNLWIEYDHMGFGTKNVVFTGEGPIAGNLLRVDVKQSVNTVLLGVDYRFGGGAGLR